MNLVERVAARHRKVAHDLPEWLFGAEGHKLQQEAAKAVEHVIKSKCGVNMPMYQASGSTETEHIMFGFDEAKGSGGKSPHGRFLLTFDAVLTDCSMRVIYRPFDPKKGNISTDSEEEFAGNVEQKNVVHTATSLAEKLCSKVHAQMKANAEAATKGKRKMEAEVYRVAGRHLAELIADQNKAAPKKVDDLFKEVKDGNPSYSDDQAWATAWSIYCKHVDPNGEHCHKGPGGYLKEASEAEKVRGYLARSIKHMKDITGPKWEKFAKENPGLAAASVHMAAQDAVRAMEEADKLLAGMPKTAEVSRPTPLACEEEASIERPTPSASGEQAQQAQ